MDTNSYWRKFKQPQDLWYHIITALSMIIGLLGFSLNLLVIHFLMCSKSFKATSNRFLLLNLAFSDLLKVVFNIPLKVTSSWTKEWVFGYFGCQIYGFVGGLSGFVGFTTLAIMTIDRYLMIKNPLNALKSRSTAILWSIVFSWVYSLFWIGLQFFSDNGFILEGMLTSCTFDYLSRDVRSRAIVMGMFVGGFLAPLSLIIVFYILIVRLIHMKSRSLESALRIDCKMQSCSLIAATSRQHSSSANFAKNFSRTAADSDRSVIEFERQTITGSFELETSRNCSIGNKRRNGMTNVLVKRERQVTKTVVACVGFFCLSWFPYAIIVLIAQIGINVEEYVTPLTATLPALFAKTSTIFNPLIYTIVNTDCKIYFKRLLRIKEKRKSLDTNRLY